MDKAKAEQIVREALESNVTDLQLTDDDMGQTLEDIGVDSLDVMMVMMDVQEKSGVDIPDDSVGELNTPEKIVAHIVR